MPSGPEPGIEHFFDRHDELVQDGPVPEQFRTLGPEAGMVVVGTPLAESHPLQEARA
jgi:hypothetical protein